MAASAIAPDHRGRSDPGRHDSERIRTSGGQGEAAELRVDAGHQRASPNTGTNARDHGPLSALTFASLASISAIRF